MRRTYILLIVVVCLVQRHAVSDDYQEKTARDGSPAPVPTDDHSTGAHQTHPELVTTATAASATDQTAQPTELNDVIVDPPETADESDGWYQVEPTAPDMSVGIPSEDRLTPDQIALRNRIRQCLAYYFHRPETVHRRSPWGVMHAVVGFGVDTPLHTGDKQVNAIAWLCANAPCYGMRLLHSQNGTPNVRMGPGYQGHAGQFLCILAQSRVKPDYPLVVDGQRMTVTDLVRYEQSTCRVGTELTFKLIGLSHYLDTDVRWQNAQGEDWDLERLLEEELAQPIIGACCGGTHRLTGYSYAVRKREQSGQPMSGQWGRAQAYLEDYHEYTLKLQNADGSFSTDWFAKRSSWGDLNRRLNTTGHTLEWLVYSLPEHRLDDPRVVKAVTYLTDLMWQYRGQDWQIGPKGHAIHALSLYDERRFGGTPGRRAVELAQVEAVASAASAGTPLPSETPLEQEYGPDHHSLAEEEPPADPTRGETGRRRRRFR
jgi:hypothetical protein